jgi:solute carrier family 8 (sodium/calcium exchanger)
MMCVDPGTITFEERGILVKESVGVAQVPVLRKNGADGEVSVHWRTIGTSI